MLVTGCAIGMCAVVVTGTLLRRNYVAVSSFMPQTSQTTASRFAGLAAQLGVSLGNTGGSESVPFYAELVRSRELLQEVALTQYSSSPGNEATAAVTGTLI